MFKCKACGSNEFRLVIHPSYGGQIDISTNEHDDVVVEAAGQRFVADLPFMNQFAICVQCSTTKKWEYYFPNSRSTAEVGD